MSPEQFINEGSIDYNTDFWSLGILIYRLFMGIPPFGDESTTSEGVIMKNIMEMPLPDDVNKLPDYFNQLVSACLVKDRTIRPKTTSDLLDAMNGKFGAKVTTDKTKIYFGTPLDDGDFEKACRLSHLSKSHLYSLLRKYNISRPS